METILILGAAALQLPLIEFIKSRGYRVIVVSISGDYPGFKIADRCIYLDIRDYEGILAELNGENNIVGVITDQTDMSVPTVAYLSERLKVPGNSVKCAVTYSNKFYMREMCTKLHISTPLYLRANNVESVDLDKHHIHFPVMMKPEDSQGSRGVYKCYNSKDIELHFNDSKKYSKSDNVIIEEFFDGDEVVVEGFVYKGQYLLWGIGERKYFNLNDKFIPSQTIFPAYISKGMQEKLISAEKQMHSALNPHFGMIHSEYLINEKTGEYRLVETALRGGGVYISSHLIPLYTGVNNYDILLKCCLGQEICLDKIQASFKYGSSAYVCFYLPEGEIIAINGITHLMQMPEVKKVDIGNLYIGMKTCKLENKTMRLGPIIIGTSSRNETDYCIKQVMNSLSIQVRQSNNQVGGIHWN